MTGISTLVEDKWQDMHYKLLRTEPASDHNDCIPVGMTYLIDARESRAAARPRATHTSADCPATMLAIMVAARLQEYRRQMCQIH